MIRQIGICFGLFVTCCYVEKKNRELIKWVKFELLVLLETKQWNFQWDQIEITINHENLYSTWQCMWHLMWHKNSFFFFYLFIYLFIIIIFFFLSLATLAFFIYRLMLRTILTQYRKVCVQIDSIERLKTKLRYGVNDRNQICNLLKTFCHSIRGIVGLWLLWG